MKIDHNKLAIFDERLNSRIDHSFLLLILNIVCRVLIDSVSNVYI